MESDNPLIQAIQQLQLGTQFGVQMVIQYFRKALTEEEFRNPFVIQNNSQHKLYHIILWLLELYSTANSHHNSKDKQNTDTYCESVRNPPNPWQRGCPEIIPQLSTRPWWLINSLSSSSATAVNATALTASSTSIPCNSTSNSTINANSPFITSANITPDHPYYSKLSFIHKLEASVNQIRQEVLQLRGHQVFQTYRAPNYKDNNNNISENKDISTSTETSTLCSTTSSLGMEGTDRGLWNIYYLDLHHNTTINKEQSELLCPITMQLLQTIPNLYGHAMFSAMAPNTHITTHTGPTNRKLRIHLPLFVPTTIINHTLKSDYARLRVGPHTEIFQEGKCIIFDDSFQHEAWNDYDPSIYTSEQLNSINHQLPFIPSRINLIIDIWHPDLSDNEIKIFNFIRSSQIRKAKAMSDAGIIPAEADFFKILQEAHNKGIDDTIVFGSINLTFENSTINNSHPNDNNANNKDEMLQSNSSLINKDNTDTTLQPLQFCAVKDD